MTTSRPAKARTIGFSDQPSMRGNRAGPPKYSRMRIAATAAATPEQRRRRGQHQSLDRESAPQIRARPAPRARYRANSRVRAVLRARSRFADVDDGEHQEQRRSAEENDQDRPEITNRVVEHSP